MTIHLVTFATNDMSKSHDLCLISGRRHGVDAICSYSKEDIEFIGMQWGDYPVLMRLLEDNGRGCGYFAWKPFVILDRLTNLPTGRTLIYADAGIEFINNVRYIIDRMDQDIFLFGNNWEHAHWCKRDVIEAIWPYPQRGRILRDPKPIVEVDELAWERFGKQVQASVIFFRVSDYSRRFVKEWLDWCLFEGGRLIDDSPSQTPNHPEFREHRHDQAILTTMAYRDGLKLHYWPAVYNYRSSPEFVYEKLPEYVSDDYPVLFSHHRRRDHEWDATISVPSHESLVAPR